MKYSIESYYLLIENEAKQIEVFILMSIYLKLFKNKMTRDHHLIMEGITKDKILYFCYGI